MSNLIIPDPSLVVLIGPSGSGKSTFTRKQFKPTEVQSSDFYRGLVGDDEGDQAASRDAFDVLHLVVEKRLRRGRLAVVDATNLQPLSRRPLLDIARSCQVPAVAVVFRLPEELCQVRNRQRAGRVVENQVVSYQWQQLEVVPAALQGEGFRLIHVLTTLQEIEEVTISLKSQPAEVPKVPRECS